LPSLNSSHFKDSFSSLLADEKLGFHCIQILSSLGIEDLEHFPVEVLVALLEVIGGAIEIFPAEQNLWEARLEGVQAMLDLARKLEESGVEIPYIERDRNIAGNVYGGNCAKYPLPASFAQDFGQTTKRAVLPFQALLLREALEREGGGKHAKGSLKGFAVSLRHAESRTHPISRLLFAIGEELQLRGGNATGTYSSWLPFLIETLPRLRKRYKGHQPETDFLRKVEAAVSSVANIPLGQDRSHKSMAQDKGQQWRPPQFQRTDPEDIPVRRAGTQVPPAPRASRLPAPPLPEEDPESPEHGEQTLGETSVTPAEATPASAERERLQLRYSGYNTALDNQHIPFTWDSLSCIEIACLAHHLRTDLASQDDQRLEQAWWAGLILATGQTFDLIEAMACPLPDEIEDWFGDEGVWRRSLRLPRGAFKPRNDQKAYLIESDQEFDLPLPHSLGSLAARMLAKHRALASGGHVRVEGLVRDYCNHLRELTGMRFLPGRLASALKPKVMGLTGDPVVVHLLAGRPTDLPPSDVFYTTYDPDHLVCVYRQATSDLLAEQA
jgi:hypothetical protein